MTCTSPFKLQGKEGKIYLLPCGYCMSCRVARNREWAARLLHEKTNHKHSAFLTLTFAPENIPPLDSIQKDTLQKFLKRLRKSLEPRKFGISAVANMENFMDTLIIISLFLACLCLILTSNSLRPLGLLVLFILVLFLILVAGMSLLIF